MKAKIIHKEEKRIIRKLKDSVIIRRTEEASSHPSIDVSSIWLPVLQNKETGCVTKVALYLQ
jgi:hypothetical protein